MAPNGPSPASTADTKPSDVSGTRPVAGGSAKARKWTDVLNGMVAKKTHERRAKSGGGELEIEFSALEKPMTALWAGTPVYQERPEWLLYVVAAACVSAVAWGAAENGAVATAVAMLLGLFVYDFFSGVLHVVLDHPPNVNLPLIGQGCLEFMWHHHIAQDIAIKPLVQSWADLTIPLVGFGLGNLALIACCAPTAMHPSFLASLVSSKVLWAFYGQWSHRMAHSRGAQRTPLARRLQRLGLLVPPHVHHKHHTAPHDTHFCLIGWFGPVVQQIYERVPPRGVLFLFFAMGFADNVILAALLAPLLGLA